MTIKLLKVVRHPDRVALEYSVVDGYPQTFANEPGDDRCTWENLRLACKVGHTTDDDCVNVALALLKREVETPTQEERDLKAAQEFLEPEA